MTEAKAVSTTGRRLPIAGPSGPGGLGVLSLHLDGTPCRVGCEFCYLGARAGRAQVTGEHLSPALLEELLSTLDYREVAVALSEPVAPWLSALGTIVAAATARGRKVAVTTTAAVLGELEEAARATGRDPLQGVQRVSLSVDPRKGPTEPRWVAAAARRARPPGSQREVALIASLVDERFASWLVAGGLAELLALPEVDRVALHGLKPPPPWCDKAFWLRSFAKLAPLLERHLDRRLFLDCYVAARILDLGGCPARPDVSPGSGAPGAVGEFRSCVYQPVADFEFQTAAELAAQVAGFSAPATCPFPIR